MIDCIGNWASIVSFLISLLTFIYALFINSKVKLIKKKVMFNTRVEPLLNDLKTFTLNIKNQYSDFSNKKNELKVEIARCKVQLESILPKIPNKQKKEFKIQIQELKKIQKSTLGEPPNDFKKKWYKRKTTFKKADDIWQIYVGMTECVNRISNLLKDKTVI
jgi:hypothetical protein